MDDGGGPSASPQQVRVDIVGGDPFGRGDRPALSWWLPPGATRQDAYQVRTDDGFDTGRVASANQSFVDVPVFDAARRSTVARVRVWTDAGASGWSGPVRLESGLLAEADWTARWIGVDEPDRDARPAWWLRTTFEAPADPDARLYLTALGLYEAFLNGARVGDAELTPGYTQYRRRVQYQAYDVGHLLRPGGNVLAVLLADGWFRGRVGMPRATDQYGTELALRGQLEVRTVQGWDVVCGTDPTWRTAPSHVDAADLIAGQREDHARLDAARHDASFDDTAWARAVARDVDVAIVGSIAPPNRRVEELRPVSVRPLPDHAFIVDLGQNINGWTRLTNLGPAGTRLRLAHGEWLDAQGDLTTGHLDVNVPILPAPLPLGQIDEVVSAGSGDRFEPRFTTHGFQYVRVEGHPGPLTADDVTGVVVHADLRRLGWFECSDERVNRLHRAVVWSLRGNLCDIPTDCPQRERAGWTGDMQILAPVAAYLFDVLGLTRKWLRDVALDQRADGCVANMSPLPPVEGFDGPLGGLHGSAGWGDAVVSVPWDLYQAYGDLSLLREAWPAMTAWLDFAARSAAGGRHPGRAARRPDPLPHERFLWDTGFHWGEWLEPDAVITDFRAFATQDKSDVATAYLHRSAGIAARVAELLDAGPATVARYRELAEGALEAWRAEWLDPDGGLLVPTQAAHVRALAFGLVDDGKSTVERLVELVGAAGGHPGTGFLSTRYLLPVLAEHGHLNVAYDLLLQTTPPSWLTMVARGATTIWEHWEGVDADGVPHESLNHASKGAVVDFLHHHVAGLRPTAPGYRTFEVRPRPGGELTSASTRHVSPYGPIEVAWRRDGRALELSVSVPPGTTATVLRPAAAEQLVGPGHHRWLGPAIDPA